MLGEPTRSGPGNVPIEASERDRGMFPFWEDGNVPGDAGKSSWGTFPLDRAALSV